VVLLLGSLSALETPGPANTANQQSESPVFFVHLDTSSLSPNLLKPQLLTTGSLASSDSGTQSDVSDSQPASSGEDGSERDAKVQPIVAGRGKDKQPDFNRDIFFANKFEFSQEVGWLPINVPCPFDFLMGDPYVLYPLKYTLVPIISTLRWQIDDLDGPWFLRGNWELDTSGAVVAIPRGPETRYFSWIMGMRRNFVPRKWRATPYWDWRIGLGNIDAKGPIGVRYAQGQDFTFTLNMGSGVRYNFSPRYAVSAGLNWMHISNANLSQNEGFRNVGINVYGPVIAVDMQLRRHRHTE